MLIFLLSCYGLTNILVFGHIFDKLRPKYKFFHCPMCIGFWVGVALSLIVNIGLTQSLIGNMFLSGLISSGWSYLVINIADDDGIRISLKGVEK